MDFELAKRHNAYTFNTTSTVTVTNDIKGVKLKLLGNVCVKQKKIHA